MKFCLIICFLVQMASQWCFFTSFSETDQKILALDYSPNGKFIAIGSSSNRVSIFSTKTYDLLWFDTLSNDVLSVKFSSDNLMLAVTQIVNDTLLVYNIDAQGRGSSIRTNVMPPRNRNNPQGGWNEVDFNVQNNKIVLCGNQERSYRSDWNGANGLTLTCENYDNDDDFVACKFNSVGDTATCTNDDEIYVCKADGTKTKLQIGTTSVAFLDLDFIPGTRDVLALMGDNRILKWNVDADCDPMSDCNPLITGATSTKLTTVSCSGDGLFFAAAGETGFFYLFNTTNMSPNEIFFRYDSDFLSIRVSDSGN